MINITFLHISSNLYYMKIFIVIFLCMMYSNVAFYLPNQLTLYNKNIRYLSKDPLKHPEKSIIEQRRNNSYWPFKKSLKVPEYLDGTLAGDLGFDPLQIARDKEGLFTLREAEYKHGRLAMLAALGWPVSELVHYELARSMGYENLLAPGLRAPSVLNGGLDNAFVLFGLGLFLTIGSYLELKMIEKKASDNEEVPEELKNFFEMWRQDGYDAPGNYGFDPLGLGKNHDNETKILIQTVEIFNARIAMLATLGYVVQENLTGLILSYVLLLVLLLSFLIYFR